GLGVSPERSREAADRRESSGEDAQATKPQATVYIQAPWPAADVIIGNPPFLGAKRLKPERGADYVNAVRKLYPEVPGMADYCVYWIRRSHDHLPDCTRADPFAGRAGLVGTQNIRNNQSRVGGLDHVAATGTIVEAVDNQPWSGEANVHVSIANWIKSQDAAVVPKVKRLWTKVPVAAGSRGRRSKDKRADNTYELKDRETDEISASLSDSEDVTGALQIQANQKPKRVFQGNTPGHDGFVLSADETGVLLKKDDLSKEVVRPYLIGRELLSGDGLPDRFIIDFAQRDQMEAGTFSAAFAHVQANVLPDIRSKAEAEKGADRSRRAQLERWWMHWRSRADRAEAAAKLRGRYIVCSRVTKRPIFVFVSTDILPGDALQTFTFDDDYSFGQLQSSLHFLWFVTNCSKLKSDFRYTPESVFDTFPWPQSPTKAQIDAVASTGREVRRVRAEALAVIDGGLRAVYRTLELPGKHPLKETHAALDAAVLDAYGFSPKQDLLAQLLELNHAVAAREKRGEPVTAPGVPPGYPEPAQLVTSDCIRP
ncbi:MAG: type IIL restriction-modification enzyme MmeI, partial [Tepidisphaeraceae bacterium]